MGGRTLIYHVSTACTPPPPVSPALLVTNRSTVPRQFIHTLQHTPLFTLLFPFLGPSLAVVVGGIGTLATAIWNAAHNLHDLNNVNQAGCEGSRSDLPQ